MWDENIFKGRIFVLLFFSHHSKKQQSKLKIFEFNLFFTGERITQVELARP